MIFETRQREREQKALSRSKEALCSVLCAVSCELCAVSLQTGPDFKQDLISIGDGRVVRSRAERPFVRYKRAVCKSYHGHLCPQDEHRIWPLLKVLGGAACQ